MLSLGFAIKAGVLGVHMWLPLAHPAAPVPASAVLSGAMIKAGLVGALGVIGVGDLSAYAGLLIPLGIGAALLGALAGISQTNAKTLLAYSSISQMGLMIVIVGLMLAAAEPAAALALLMLFMLNHGLAKGALFLAVGVSGQTQGTARWLVLALTALPALALIGLAPTAGYAAKEALEALAYDAAAARLDLLPMALTMSSVATALLMLRLTLLLAGMDAKAAARPAPVLAFATLALLSLATPLLPAVHGMSFAAFAPVQLIDSGEPLAIALALMAVAYVLPRHLVKPIPAGDVILLIEAAWQQMLKLIHALDAWAEALDRWWQARLAAMQAWLQRLSDLAGSIEQQLARWPVMGAALVAILFVLVALGQQGGV